MSKSVIIDVEVKSPITKVWDALTTSETLSQWMMFKTNDFSPELGHTFQFRDAPGYDGVIDCEVTVLDPPNTLAYTWATVGVNDAAHQSVVTWTLSEGEGVTKIHLEQSGFADDARQEVGGAKAGWTYQLAELEKVLSANSIQSFP